MERRKRLAHEFFVRERAVDFGRVEERDAAVHCGMEKIGHLLLIFGRTVGKAHAHAAEPESRNFQIAFAKFALLHCFSSRGVERWRSNRYLPDLTDNEKIPASTISSVVCLHFERLPIPPKYLPDPPRLLRDRMHTND